MGIDAVIFDFNGVLVDDESVHFSLFSEVLAKEGVQLSLEEYVERYLGYDDRKCFEKVLLDSQKSVDTAYIDRLIAQRHAVIPKLPVKACVSFQRRAKPWKPCLRDGQLRSAQGLSVRKSSTL